MVFSRSAIVLTVCVFVSLTWRFHFCTPPCSCFLQAVDTVADTEVMLDDLGLPGGVRALTDSCLVRPVLCCPC
jgi:hypothetical protein